MRKLITIILFLLLALSSFSQEKSSAVFIGCRTSDGWAETTMLRKTFELTESEINGGTVYIWMSSLGYHELYVNGKRIGDKVLQPAVSQLNKRSLWLIYDITPYVNKGKNEVVFWVGQGWGRVYGIPAAVVAEVTWNDGK